MMDRSLRPSALLLTLAVTGAGGCATTAPTAGPGSSWEAVTSEEIRRSSASNAFDLVHQVRPNWLRGRGVANFRSRQPVLPVVYLNSVRQGNVEVLRGFPTNGLVELRYVDATTATTFYGDGHAGGVIEVVLRRRN